MKFFDASRYASPLRKALDKKENAPRNLRFETLETRSLLSVTPLDNLEAVASAEIAPAQTEETPVVDLSTFAASKATLESNADDQYEGETGNNTVDTATQLGTLTKKTTIEAFAGTGRESDYYRVKFDYVGTEDDYLRLEVPEGSAAPLFFALKTSTGGNLSGYSAQTVDGAKVISLENLPKGEYVIQVYHTNSTASTPYALTIEPSKPEADDKYEGETNNDTLADATDLGWVGSLAIDAKAGPSRNVDCYKFTLLGQGTADNYVGLNYVKASNVQLNFRIYNAAGDEIFSNVHNWATDKIENFSLEGLAAGDYYVEIVANQNLDVFSKYTLTINAPKVEPSAPTNFKATENVSEETSKITKNETTLAWDAVENATYYELRYSTNDANPTWSNVEKVEDLSQAVSLAFGTSYKYQVRAVTVYNDNLSGDPAVEGAWTDLEFATVDAPVAPTQLTVSKLDPETHTVKLTWKDVVDENEYQVLLLNAGGELVAESDLAANQTSWTPNYQFDLGGSYYFEIRAKNNAGYGDFAALDFTVEDVPAQPTDLTATLDASFNATLTWIAPTATENENEAVTGYEVAILDENDEWQVVDALAADATEWTTDAPLDPAATHALAVRAVNEYGVSAWTTVELETPEAPSTLVTTADDVVDPFDDKISLREAIQYAEAGATITFADDVETITLAGTQLEITKALTIDGGENGVTVDADGKSLVFNVDAADGTVALQNLTVTGGYTNSNGGGVYVADGAASFTNVTIAGNTAGTNGGGVHVDYAATATFTNVTISGNTADNGGGGVNLFGTATFTNVAIVDNTARFYGGGVYVYDVEATFTNATISGNQSESGGSGAYVHEGTLNFYNSILVGNAYDVSVTTYAGTANADRTLSNFFYWANANEEGVTNYVYDATQPLFNDAENGDYTLAAGSQAINKGNAAYLADEITTDLAGNPRFNCAVDLGAYESQALFTPTNLTVSKLDPETRQVTFTWDDVDLETEYLVMLWSSNGDVQTVLAADATSWTPDFEFALGATGFISITPTNNAGVGAPALLTFTLEDVPAQPTDLIATVDAAFNATLTWTADADADATPATAYEVAIRDENGEWQVVATLAADATEWTTDAPLAAASTYNYAVRAVNEYGVSAWTSVEFATFEAASTVVTTAEDVVDAYDGEISLREAIEYAEAGATITFADGVETITLAGTELTIDKALTIQGFVDETGAPQITIDANEQSGVFTVAEGTSAAFYGLTITGGYTDWNGGGVYVQGFAATTFTNVKITKNTAVMGGGVHAENGASVIFTNVEITENVADFNGGGASICASASAIFTNVEISGNVANQGGGVFVQGGKATLTNVAITENQGNQGVGLSVQGGEATLTNATLVRNLQILGGNSVFLMASTATFNNSIIDGNASFFGATANAYNTLSSYTDWTNANEEGVTNYVYDATQPLFNDAENGDFTLAAGSQAINKGNAAYLADEITTDLAGNPRFNGAVDLGAYESQTLFTPTNLTVSKLDPETRQVTFTWDDVDLETEYLVLLWTVDGQVQTVLPANTTSWTPDVEFPLGSSAFISITPTNADGAGAPAVLTFAVEDVPAAPTNFKATANLSTEDESKITKNETTLVWDDVDAETGYELQVSTDGGATWTSAGTFDADVTSFDVADLAYGTAYQYQLRAVNEYGVSDWVDLEFSTVAAPTTPVNLTVSKLDPETRKVTFTWDDVADETEYVVLLFTVDGQVQTVLPANTTSWTPDVEFALGSSGFISIAPANNAGVATVPAILTFAVEDVPAAPTLEATVNASTAPTVTLNWTNVEGETGYRVEVQAEDETGTYVWTTLAELDADVDNYTTDVQMGQTYFYRVVALNEYGETVSAHKRVAVGDVSVAPTLEATVNASTAPTATLTWNNVADETGYRVEILDGETWTLVQELAADATEWTTDVQMGATYTYRVVAVNAYGETASEAVVFTVGNVADAPTLEATVNASTAPTVTLNWTNVEGETGYRVEVQAEDETGTYVWTTLAELDADVDNYTTDVQMGQTYYYRVVAVNAYGETVSAHKRVAVGNVADAPTSLSFKQYVALNGTGTTQISWTDSNNENGYVVEYKELGAETWSSLGSTNADATALKFKNYVPGTTYVYRVGALNEYGVSWSDEVEFTPLAAPSEVAIVSYNGAEQTIALEWTGVSTNATQYRVQVSVDGSDWTTLKTVDASVTSTTVAAAPGSTYVYRVAALNANGVSAWTKSDSFDLIDAPSNIAFKQYTASSGKSAAKISWVDNSNDETGYRVEFKEVGADEWTLLAVVNANVTSKIFTNLEPGTDYVYRVRAEKADGESAWAEAAFSPLVAPSEATFGEYDAETGKVLLSWSAVENTELYRVEVKVDDGEWKLVKVVSGATSHALSNVQPGSTYAFRVRAHNDNGASTWTESAVFAPLLAPSDVTLDQTTGTVTWNDNTTGETLFRVETSTDGVVWSPLGTAGANETSLTNEALATTEEIFVRVRAENDFSASPWAEVTLSSFAAPSDIAFKQFTASNGKSTAQISWVDNSNDEIGYRVEFKEVGSDNWKLLTVVDANATSTKFANFEPGTDYLYRVRAERNGAVSAWTEAAFSPLVAPSEATFGEYDAENGSAILSWTEVENATLYRVEVKVDDGEWKLVKVVNGATSYALSNVQPGSTYAFRVRAHNDNGASTWTESSVVTLALAATPEVSAAKLTSDAFASAFDEFDFFCDEDELDAWAKRLV